MNHVNQLRQIIHASGLTQEALAVRLGVSFVTVNAWINERSKPRKAALAAIEILHAELVGGSDLDSSALAELLNSAESQKFNPNKLFQDRQLLKELTVTLTYHTDAIEGSTMTVADTEVVLFEDRTLSNRTLVEQLEAKNHQAALWWLLDELREATFAIDIDLITGLHARLMNGILADAGRFRRHAVRIAGTRVTVANYLRIPELLNELCSTATSPGQSLVAVLAKSHARFEKIHPFSDGNGRVGRLLLLAAALRANVVPPIIMRERRTFYYKALERAQLDENYALLEQLIAESIVDASQNIFGNKHH